MKGLFNFITPVNNYTQLVRNWPAFVEETLIADLSEVINKTMIPLVYAK